MEFLGIGPLELLFIIVIIIVVIGPKDIQRTMRGLGRGLNALYKSDAWRAFNDVSRELRGLPNRLAREAELEELEQASKEINQAIASTTPSLTAWTTPADGKQTIQPPPAKKPAAAPAPAQPPAPAGDSPPESQREPEPPAATVAAPDPPSDEGRNGASNTHPA
jgi:Sec-independent protein translocase protein TatA